MVWELQSTGVIGGKVKFKIVLADKNNPDHICAIQRLWDNNLRFIGEGRFEWLYQNNPAGDTITCLAVVEKTGEIIGTASAMCRNFHFDGKTFKAGIAIDFAIDVEYRVFGPALLLQRTLVEQAWGQGLDFMLGFPNLASQGIVRRVGYERIGNSMRFSRLIRTRDKLTAVLRERGLPTLLAGPASVVLDAGLYLKTRLSGSQGTARTIASEKEFGDYQWRAFQYGNIATHTFHGEYGEDFIRWRYLQCPYKDYQLFSLFDEQQPVAFLVFSFSDNGLVLVDDFRYLEEKWLAPLFHHFWRKMHRNVHVAINVGLVVGENTEKLMTDAGFIARPSERWGGILSNPDISMDWRKILNEGGWYIADGEIDL